MNRRDALSHFWHTFILAYGSFRTVVVLQAFAAAALVACFSTGVEERLIFAFGTFFSLIAGGVLFGFLPMLLGFTPLYALLSAKGRANWITSLLAGLLIAGVLCIHPILRLMAHFWVIDSTLIALLTHRAYRKQLRDLADKALRQIPTLHAAG